MSLTLRYAAERLLFRRGPTFLCSLCKGRDPFVGRTGKSAQTEACHHLYLNHPKELAAKLDRMQKEFRGRVGREPVKNSNMTVREETPEYQVRCITDHIISPKGEVRFGVLWAGYPDNHKTYEPLKNLGNAAVLVSAYLRKNTTWKLVRDPTTKEYALASATTVVRIPCEDKISPKITGTERSLRQRKCLVADSKKGKNTPRTPRRIVVMAETVPGVAKNQLRSPEGNRKGRPRKRERSPSVVILEEKLRPRKVEPVKAAVTRRIPKKKRVKSPESPVLVSESDSALCSHEGSASVDMASDFLASDQHSNVSKESECESLRHSVEILSPAQEEPENVVYEEFVLEDPEWIPRETGFQLGWRPERIVGIDGIGKPVRYLVKWTDSSIIEPVESSILIEQEPDLLIDFLEDRLVINK